MPAFPYKAVLSDIDGTLLGPAGAVSALTVRAVGRLVRGVFRLLWSQAACPLG